MLCTHDWHPNGFEVIDKITAITNILICAQHDV